MAPAAPRTCDYPGCSLGPPDDNGVRGPYVIHVENTRKEEVIEDLKTHLEMAHTLPLKAQELELKKQQNVTEQTIARTKEIEAQTRKIIVERG